MLITSIENVDNKKYRLYIDCEYTGIIYKSDIKRYKLIEGELISKEVFDNLIEDTLFRRAKQKALCILERGDNTQKQLYDKLKKTGYSINIIDRTIEYVKSFNYIDDKRFAKNFIRNKISSKSKKQIIFELTQKGIDKEVINILLEQEFDNDEEIAIKKAILKKTSNIDILTYEEKQKIASYLYRKGFNSYNIKKYLNI